jgi:hypothetical protein
MDCYKIFFLQFFENSSDELGTGNTRHFRKSIVKNMVLTSTMATMGNNGSDLASARHFRH